MDIIENEEIGRFREHARMLLEEGLAGDVKKAGELSKLFESRIRGDESPEKKAVFVELKNRLKQEAERENAFALNVLAVNANWHGRKMGPGGQRDAKFEKSKRLYERAASRENMPAQNALAPLYADVRKSAQWSLFRLYFEGYIGRVDAQPNYEEAVNWCRLAAQEGNPLAQNNLGCFYLEGRIGTMNDQLNYEEAANWFRLAAEGGNSRAQNTLGALYCQGHIGRVNGQPNYGEAAKWFRLAAEQGVEESEAKLTSLGEYINSPGNQLRAIEVQQFLYTIRENRIDRLTLGVMPEFENQTYSYKEHPKQWLKLVLKSKNIEETLKQAVVLHFVFKRYPLNKLVWEKALLGVLGKLLLNYAKGLETYSNPDATLTSETQTVEQEIINRCLMRVHKDSDSWIEAQLILLTKLQSESVEAVKAQGISDGKEITQRAYANIADDVEAVKRTVNKKMLEGGLSDNEQIAFEALERRIKVWQGETPSNSRKRSRSTEINGAPKRVDKGKAEDLS